MHESRTRSVQAGAGLTVCAVIAVANAWPNVETTVDDAWISARYAWNLAAGHGLVYNAGEPPIEGYTNLLWVLLGAGAQAAGLPMAAVLAWGGLLCALLGLGFALGLTHHLAGRWHPVLLLAPLILALSPHYVVAATNGLETAMFAAGLLGAVWAGLAAESVRGRVGAGLALAALGLVRPEGMVIGFLVAMWDLLRRRGTDRLVLTGVVGVLQVGILAWRLLTYGDIVPNTLHAKSNVGLTKLLEINGDYVGMDGVYWPIVGALLLLSPLIPPRRPDRWLVAVLALTITVIAFRVPMWMPAARLLVPALALVVCNVVAPLVAGGWRTWAAGALFAGAVGVLLSPVHTGVRAYDRRHTVLAENPAALAARHLAEHAPDDAWIAVRDAGVVAYWVGPEVKVAELHDRALTQPHPDGAPLDLSLLPRDPTFIVLTQAREDATGFRYGNDRKAFQRARGEYEYLGRVYQHYHRYYDIYARADAAIPPLPDALVVNRAGPPPRPAVR